MNERDIFLIILHTHTQDHRFLHANAGIAIVAVPAKEAAVVRAPHPPPETLGAAGGPRRLQHGLRILVVRVRYDPPLVVGERVVLTTVVGVPGPPVLLLVVVVVFGVVLVEVVLLALLLLLLEFLRRARSERGC